jgi:hypothetical protein
MTRFFSLKLTRRRPRGGQPRARSSFSRVGPSSELHMLRPPGSRADLEPNPFSLVDRNFEVRIVKKFLVAFVR